MDNQFLTAFIVLIVVCCLAYGIQWGIVGDPSTPWSTGPEKEPWRDLDDLDSKPSPSLDGAPSLR